MMESKIMPQTRSAAKRLRQNGILARAIRPPAVPEGASRIRFSISLGHRMEDLEAAIREKGIRGTARDMGIDEGTVRYHLKTRSGKL